MKLVIFICFLSISMCLCQPTNTSVTGAPITSNAPAHAEVKPDALPLPTPAHDANGESKPESSNNSAKPLAPVTNGTVTEANALPTTQSPPTSQAPAKPTQADQTTPKPTKEETKTLKPEESNATTANIIPTTVKPSESTVVNDDAKKQDNTTHKNDVPAHSTEVPKAQVLQARGFDGPSFIGGIILTLGLLAIGFMGLKYYKNQTERNYHTL